MKVFTLLVFSILISPRHAVAGELTMREDVARGFAKRFMRCIKKNDIACLSKLFPEEPWIRELECFGCKTTSKKFGHITPHELAQCILQPPQNPKSRISLRDVVVGCFTGQSTWDENAGEFKSKRGFKCAVDGNNLDDQRLGSISLPDEAPH